MHEVELIKQIRSRLDSRVDIDDPDIGAPSEATVRRVTLAALEVLGIRVAPDGTVQLPPTPAVASSPSAIEDAGVVTGSVPECRAELVRRIASNKGWLEKNWHLGKEPRRDCQANIDRDERELAKLNAAAPEQAPREPR